MVTAAAAGRPSIIINCHGMLPGHCAKTTQQLARGSEFKRLQGTLPNFSGAERCLERYLSLQPAAKCFSVAAATRQPPGEHNAFPSLTWSNPTACVSLQELGQNGEVSWYVLLTSSHHQ
jgi:hypothetical protein